MEALLEEIATTKKTADKGTDWVRFAKSHIKALKRRLKGKYGEFSAF